MDKDGSIGALNSYIDLGSDLPKLASGVNTFTIYLLHGFLINALASFIHIDYILTAALISGLLVLLLGSQRKIQFRL